MSYYSKIQKTEYWVPHKTGRGPDGPIFYGHHFYTKEDAKRDEFRYTAQPLYITYRTNNFNHNNDEIISCRYRGFLITSNLYGINHDRYIELTGFDVRKADGTIIKHFNGGRYTGFQNALNYVDKRCYLVDLVSTKVKENKL